jgi:hypothetical protein
MKWKPKKMETTWKQIEGFENYDISTTGIVRSYLKRKRRTKGNGYEFLKMNEPQAYLKYGTSGFGYYYVNLYDNDGQPHAIYIHKCVAETFIPNPLNHYIVDHIDRNKTNNNINNLRWCNHSQNTENRGIQSNNKSGEQHIHFETYTKRWRVEFKREGVKYKSKRFQTLQDAIDHRNLLMNS